LNPALSVIFVAEKTSGSFRDKQRISFLPLKRKKKASTQLLDWLYLKKLDWTKSKGELA